MSQTAQHLDERATLSKVEAPIEAGRGIGVGFMYSVRGGAAAPAEARHGFEARISEKVDEVTLETLRLLIGEVVTNCVQHGGAADGRPIDIVGTLRWQVVRVSVASVGPPFRHVPRRPEPSELTGRGLYLVDVLSRSWGVENGSRTAVWFEVDREPRSRFRATG